MKRFPSSAGVAGRAQFIDNRRHSMNLPDAPIAQEGFFADHFFTVKDQEKARDF